MAIASETARAQYTLSGSGQTLSVPFYFLANADLLVTKTVAGVDTTLVLTTDYTVTGAGNTAGGSITLVAGTSGDVVTISRGVALTQDTALTYLGQASAAAFERGYDRLAMQVQKLGTQVARALRLPVSSAAVDEMGLAARKGKTMQFNATTGALELTASADSAAAEAQASATAAEEARTVAETAAEEALASAEAAAGGAGAWQVKSANFTAVNDAYYRVTATATITNPSPVEGKGYVIDVRNGTATIGGTAYAAPRYVLASFHSGAWSYREFADTSSAQKLTNKDLSASTNLLPLSQDASLAPHGFRTGYIYPRHRRLASILQDAQSAGTFVTGAGAGNSIMAGSTASSASLQFSYVVGTKLRTYYGVGTNNNWALVQWGVGGANVGSLAAYVASTNVSGTNPQRGRAHSVASYVCFMSLRNSAGALELSRYAALLRASILQVQRAGLDVIFITEPPQIDSSGAVLDDASNWGPWHDCARRICAQEGASWVDAWSYFMALKRAGTDLRTLMNADGVHPNDAGHEIIGDLLFDCIVAPVESGAIANVGTSDARTYLVANYTGDSGSVSAISGVTTATTARAVALNEGANNAYVLTATASKYFRSPVAARGAIVILVGGSSYSGTATVFFDGIFKGTASAGGTVREGFFYFPVTTSDSTDGTNFEVQVQATSGTIAVAGVVFVGSDVWQLNPRWANATEVGTWSDATQSDASLARSSSTIADYADVVWYGTALSVVRGMGAGFGKFTYATDGSGSTESNCYLSAPDTVRTLLVAKNLALGWHTTRFTITAKDASASGNLVKLGTVTTYSASAKPQARLVAMAAGETLYLPDAWSSVRVATVLSGSPTAYGFVANATSFTLGGSGAAMVEFSR